MNSLSYFDLKNFSQWLQEQMLGAQLQDAWTNGQMIVFQFYRFKEIFLTVDASTPHPQMFYSEVRPPVEKRPKPFILFLNSHGKNLRWMECHVEVEKGRVMDVVLSGGPREAHLQIQLIPNAFNILLQADGKQVSWEKPRDLPVSQNQTSDGVAAAAQNWIELGKKWFVEKFQTPQSESSQKAGSKSAQKMDPRLRALEKKKKARLMIEEQLGADLSERWQQLGESLKISQEVPDDLNSLYKAQQTRSWNLENAFKQAKLLRQKRAGTLARSEKLKEEIAELEKDLALHPEAQVQQAKSESKVSQLLEKTGSQGRRLQLENGLEAVIGKSAADNLAILRRAQAWDLWMHLKDYPGAHAIIIRPRSKEVGGEAIQKVAEWLIRESLSNQKIQWGSHYDVVVAECRYVRPIKGDRLGRVTYHNPQVYSFASKL